MNDFTLIRIRIVVEVLLMPSGIPINILKRKLAEFCKRWRAGKLALLGWVSSYSIGPDCNLAVLVILEPGGA